MNLKIKKQLPKIVLAQSLACTAILANGLYNSNKVSADTSTNIATVGAHASKGEKLSESSEKLYQLVQKIKTLNLDENHLKDTEKELQALNLDCLNGKSLESIVKKEAEDLKKWILELKEEDVKQLTSKLDDELHIIETNLKDEEARKAESATDALEKNTKPAAEFVKEQLEKSGIDKLENGEKYNFVPGEERAFTNLSCAGNNEIVDIEFKTKILNKPSAAPYLQYPAYEVTVDAKIDEGKLEIIDELKLETKEGKTWIYTHVNPETDPVGHSERGIGNHLEQPYWCSPISIDTETDILIKVKRDMENLSISAAGHKGQITLDIKPHANIKRYDIKGDNIVTIFEGKQNDEKEGFGRYISKEVKVLEDTGKIVKGKPSVAYGSLAKDAEDRHNNLQNLQLPTYEETVDAKIDELKLETKEGKTWIYTHVNPETDPVGHSERGIGNHLEQAYWCTNKQEPSWFSKPVPIDTETDIFIKVITDMENLSISALGHKGQITLVVKHGVIIKNYNIKGDNVVIIFEGKQNEKEGYVRYISKEVKVLEDTGKIVEGKPSVAYGSTLTKVINDRNHEIIAKSFKIGVSSKEKGIFTIKTGGILGSAEVEATYTVKDKTTGKESQEKTNFIVNNVLPYRLPRVVVQKGKENQIMVQGVPGANAVWIKNVHFNSANDLVAKRYNDGSWWLESYYSGKRNRFVSATLDLGFISGGAIYEHHIPVDIVELSPEVEFFIVNGPRYERFELSNLNSKTMVTKETGYVSPEGLYQPYIQNYEIDPQKDIVVDLRMGIKWNSKIKIEAGQRKGRTIVLLQPGLKMNDLDITGDNVDLVLANNIGERIGHANIGYNIQKLVAVKNPEFLREFSTDSVDEIYEDKLTKSVGKWETTKGYVGAIFRSIFLNCPYNRVYREKLTEKQFSEMERVFVEAVEQTVGNLVVDSAIGYVLWSVGTKALVSGVEIAGKLFLPIFEKGWCAVFCREARQGYASAKFFKDSNGTIKQVSTFEFYTGTGKTLRAEATNILRQNGLGENVAGLNKVTEEALGYRIWEVNALKGQAGFSKKGSGILKFEEIESMGNYPKDLPKNFTYIGKPGSQPVDLANKFKKLFSASKNINPEAPTNTSILLGKPAIVAQKEAARTTSIPLNVVTPKATTYNMPKAITYSTSKPLNVGTPKATTNLTSSLSLQSNTNNLDQALTNTFEPSFKNPRPSLYLSQATKQLIQDGTIKELLAKNSRSLIIHCTSDEHGWVDALAQIAVRIDDIGKMFFNNSHKVRLRRYINKAYARELFYNDIKETLRYDYATTTIENEKRLIYDAIVAIDNGADAIDVCKKLAHDLEKSSSLLISNGDSFGPYKPSIFPALAKEYCELLGLELPKDIYNPMIRGMLSDPLGYDLIGFGNHDANYPLDWVDDRIFGENYILKANESAARISQAAPKTEFQNIIEVDSKHLVEKEENMLDQSTDARVSSDIFVKGTGLHAYNPSIIKEVEVNGTKVKIAALQFTHPDTFAENPAKNTKGLELKDINEALKELVRVDEKGNRYVLNKANHGAFEKVDFITVAWHIATKDPRLAELIKNNNFIDLVIAGHDHISAIVEMPDATNRLIPVVNPGNRCLGTAIFDVKNVNGKPQINFLMAENYPRDLINTPAKELLEDPYIQRAKEFTKQVSETKLAEIPKDFKSNAKQEALVKNKLVENDSTNLILELKRHIGQELLLKKGINDNAHVISVHVPGSESFQAGTILTVDNIQTALLFDSNCYVIQIIGADLKAYMETVASYYIIENGIYKTTPAGKFNEARFGGVNYVYDLTKPVGQRTTAAYPDGTPVKDTDTLYIVVDNYQLGKLGALRKNLEEIYGCEAAARKIAKAIDSEEVYGFFSGKIKTQSIKLLKEKGLDEFYNKFHGKSSWSLYGAEGQDATKFNELLKELNLEKAYLEKVQ